jgi:O-succinylhomoserine sulfhydrylase
LRSSIWNGWPALAKKHELILNVDNCFATPVNQRPIEFGADLVVHSATKWLDGQGRVLGGAVVGRKELIQDYLLILPQHRARHVTL